MEAYINVKQKVTDNQIEYLMKKLIVKKNNETNMVEGYVFSKCWYLTSWSKELLKYPNIDIVYIIDMTGNVSLRTRKPDKVDCAAIAKHDMVVEGHIEAAGFN